MENQAIWKNIAAGDVGALRLLHDKYYCQMCLWAANYLRNETVAEELVSDCFIKLWDQKKQIIIEKSLRSYLFLMLRNQLISYVRKNKNALVTGIDKIPDFCDDETTNKQEYYAELYRAINKIPKQRREILELAVFESLTYQEIATRLNISINTVKTQMGRAYRFLKEELNPEDFIFLYLFQRCHKTSYYAC